jgi:hypothetical protein
MHVYAVRRFMSMRVYSIEHTTSMHATLSRTVVERSFSITQRQYILHILYRVSFSFAPFPPSDNANTYYISHIVRCPHPVAKLRVSFSFAPFPPSVQCWLWISCLSDLRINEPTKTYSLRCRACQHCRKGGQGGTEGTTDLKFRNRGRVC